MNNWIEIKDGDGNTMSVRTHELVAVQRVGSELTFCYIGSAFPTVKLQSEATARAAYDSLLAQLRQPEPPLTKAVQDMLREPGVVEQKPQQGPPAPHLDGCPCEECEAQRAGYQQAKEDFDSMTHSQPCPCPGCVRRREFNEKNRREIQRLETPAKDYVEPSKPRPQTPAASTVPSEEELQRMGCSIQFAKELRRQLLERQPKREELSDEQIMELAADGYEMAHGHGSWNSPLNKSKEGYRIAVRHVVRQLREAGRLL